jgi:membrane protein YqaA with SNARE-associated domain
MRSLFYSLLSYFLTPGGLVLMGALDSSLIFFLPLGIDFVVVILSARHPELFWMYAILATVGSVIGAGFTFWLGRKIGEVGLSRLIKPSRLHRIERRVSHSAAVSVGALAIIPPPFPFTAFVLTSGALRADAWAFLVTLAGVRLLRFGVESALAARYGRRILKWMDSTTFEVIVGALIVLAIAGTIVSAVAVWRSSHGARVDAQPYGKPLIR